MEKAREACLIWYGHVIRMQDDDPVKVAWRGGARWREENQEEDRGSDGET